MASRVLGVCIAAVAGGCTTAINKSASSTPLYIKPAAVYLWEDSDEFDQFAQTLFTIAEDEVELRGENRRYGTEYAGSLFTHTTSWYVSQHRALQLMHGLRNENSFLRKPLGDSAAHSLDCNKTTGVALSFIGGWKKSVGTAAPLRIKVEWQHATADSWSGTEKTILIQQDADKVMDFVVDRYRPMFWIGKQITDDMRSPGAFSVKISYRDDAVYRETFELVDCDDAAETAKSTP